MDSKLTSDSGMEYLACREVSERYVKLRGLVVSLRAARKWNCDGGTGEERK